ncbi:AsmA family protein, partial [Halochromatium sp.]
MPRWLKLTLGLFVTLLLAALGVAALAPLLIDEQQLLADLEADISLSLGRPTQIESIELLQLLPIPRLRLERVSVSESTVADAPTLATIEAVQADAAIWPLVTGRLVLAEVLLDRPRVMVSLASAPSTPSTQAAAP